VDGYEGTDKETSWILATKLRHMTNLSWISIWPIQANWAPYHDFDHFVHPVADGNPEANARILGEILKGRILLHPATPVNPCHWTTDHLGQIQTLPSITDHTHQLLTWHTQASVPIPTFGASTHSLIKTLTSISHIVITHADSFLPNLRLLILYAPLIFRSRMPICPDAWS